MNSFRQKISVDVRPQTWGERLDDFSKQFDAVKTITGGVFAATTLVLGWLGMTAIRKKPAAPVAKKRTNAGAAVALARRGL